MKNGLLAQVTELETLSIAALKERWRELYDTEPPRCNRAHLVKRLAYRVQELAFGGISDDTRARLRDHLEQEGLETATKRGSTSRRRRRKGPVVGTRFIREWHGDRYEVTVVEDGFEFQGRRYRSLSAVARAITGTQWNGPAFFGLRRPRGEQEE